MQRLTLVSLLMTMACDGGDEEPGPGPGGGDGLEGVVADLTDAVSLIHFAETRRDGTEQGPIMKVTSDGSLEEVFPGLSDEQVPVCFKTGAGTAYTEFGQVVWLSDPSVEDDPNTEEIEAVGQWCKHITYDLAVGVNEVRCADPFADEAACTNPEDPDSCSNEHDLRQVVIDEGGTVWQVDQFADEVQVYAFDGDLQIKATPIPIPADEVSGVYATEDGVLLGGSWGATELYRWDGSDVRLHAFSGTSFGGTALLYQNHVLLGAQAGGVAFLNLETKELIGSELLDFGGAEPLSNKALADGVNLYLNEPSSGDVWTCGEDFDCAVASDANLITAINGASGETPGGTLFDGTTLGVTTTDGVHFIQDGIASEDFGATMVVREMMVLDGDLHFSGVNDDNLGGLFRVEFDGTTWSFSQVESYDGEILQMATLSL
jgi:hypothetical protein